MKIHEKRFAQSIYILPDLKTVTNSLLNTDFFFKTQSFELQTILF